MERRGVSGRDSSRTVAKCRAKTSGLSESEIKFFKSHFREAGGVTGAGHECAAEAKAELVIPATVCRVFG